MKKIFSFLFLQFFVFSIVFCQNQKIDGHPAWIMQGNIYEVNIRQFTEEGTLNAFAKHLDRIKKMGVQTIWFMPINPISVVDRKGSLGSYYAVANYNTVNPEYGTMEDFKNVVKKIHKLGMKVIIDWVPNHTGCDHPWLDSHPDFFVKDSTGKPASMFDWTDTKQLNYKNSEMQDSMIAAMKYWIKKTDIDGYRVDVAWNISGNFWKKCIPQLKKIKNVFMLAEGDSSYLPKSGFDAVYPWHMFHVMEKIAKGTLNAWAIDSIRKQTEKRYPANTIQMYFTSNHDENSWNKADYETFPGAVHAPFAVLTQTMAKTVPLIYGGQEEPVLRPLKFFDKDPMEWGKYKRAKFYQTLLELRKRNIALAPNASFKKISVGNDKAVYAFVREKAGKKILVILNFSATEQNITIKDKTLHGTANNIFMGSTETLSSKKWKMEPWGYAVYEY
ncbi:alpha-amylase family glycosyl hydrolase [Ferruginibacter sp. SUN002]|uniref:alpha-amylase family glycosyl hydrolase n=1 Tax=Ferruginibacter sp. SUN002 TaxID=2937789 RepID=UPI003D36E9A9